MFKRKEFWGTLIIVLGLLILLNNLDLIDYPAKYLFRDIWPVILIIVGLALIFRQSRSKTVSMAHDFEVHSGDSLNRHHSNFFADNNVDARGANIDGMSYSTVFGDTTVNLSGGILKNGSNRLVVSATFGDVTVIVPADMEASAYSSTTFGDIYAFGKTASGISSSLTASTDGFDTAEPKVHITASTTFGDVKIYRA